MISESPGPLLLEPLLRKPPPMVTISLFEPLAYLESWMLERSPGATVRMNWRLVGREAHMIKRFASIDTQ
jgi:hypothetical protein